MKTQSNNMNTETTTPPETCPHCGADQTGGSALTVIHFRCGFSRRESDEESWRTPDCYERELAALRAQLAEARASCSSESLDILAESVKLREQRDAAVRILRKVTACFHCNGHAQSLLAIAAVEGRTP